MNPFEPPPSTRWNFLSLGAGVQSSALALMAAHGEITPMPDAAIFADTQAEPESVYAWLDWLETMLPFPVYRVSEGDLTQAILKMHTSKDGRRYSRMDIPFFTRDQDGELGMIRGRKCTSDFKIIPIRRKIRELADIQRGQKEVTVTQWLGISWDELQRMKDSSVQWQQHRWPLIERRLSRYHCIEWMKRQGYPSPPRSSCVYCPYHQDDEWRRLLDEEPEDFERAVRFERAIQQTKAATDNFKAVPFLHRTCIPLDQVDFSTDTDRGQELFGFMDECDGMCGV